RRARQSRGTCEDPDRPEERSREPTARRLNLAEPGAEALTSRRTCFPRYRSSRHSTAWRTISRCRLESDTSTTLRTSRLLLVVHSEATLMISANNTPGSKCLDTLPSACALAIASTVALAF